MANRVTRIALVGLRRVGRDLVRILHDRDDFELVAVSDRADAAALAYLLRFDTELGRFPGAVAADGDAVNVAGKRFRVLGGKAGEPSWGDLGVEAVIETAARPRARADLEAHLAAGAARAVGCGPVAGADRVSVAGVNDAALGAADRIVSHASPAAHAAAPVAQVLAAAFGIERAFLDVVHAYTEDEHLADVPAAEARRGRAAAANVIPLASAAAELVGEVLPELRGRLTAGAMSVPVANGSVADLVCWHREPVTIEAVNRVLREAATTPALAGILAYEEEPIVSSDVRRSPFSGTVDSKATMVLGSRASKTLTWFDNSWGYAQRLVDLLRRFQELDAAAAGGGGQREAGR
jgi:glyceraldehyde 3-phosphate dehydrogenase